MKNTKVLLSITNLKKYFPLPKSSIFQRNRYYVKANEDISLDIHEGETVSLVGESGCGKSTLGRTILQLYEQTAGSTMYYGRDIADIAPAYVEKTLVHAKKYIEVWHKASEKAAQVEKIVNEAGEAATFAQHQDLNLALASEQSALMNVAKVLGGFIVSDKVEEGAKLLLARHRAHIKIATSKERLTRLHSEIDLLTNQEEKDGMQKPNKLRAMKKAAKIQLKADETNNKLLKAIQEKNEIKRKIIEFKKQFKDDKEFQKYDAMLDDGIDLARLDYREMRRLRKDIQIIFQDPYSSLNPRFTIGQIIEEGLVTHGYFKHGSKKMKEYILETMRKCGLQDYMLHRYPHQFSGGQRQRICIARSLAVNPKFVVCDECVSALDVSIQSQILNLLEELKEKENLTYLFISHDLSVVRFISDRIAVMYLGNIVELADSETLFKDPRHPYTIALLSSIPSTDPKDLDKERIILEGNIPSPVNPPSGCKFHTRCFMCTEKCSRVPPKLVEVTPGHFVACHYRSQKVDENGKYLFKVANIEKKSTRLDRVEEKAEGKQ